MVITSLNLKLVSCELEIGSKTLFIAQQILPLLKFETAQFNFNQDIP